MQDFNGLTEAVALERLVKDGYNELASQKPKNFLNIVFSIAKEPMILLLIACGVIYLILGELRDSLLLVAGIFLVIGITIYEEQKSEKALEALKSLASPRALVIRDGKRQRIDSREVVLGDLVILREGDRVPADATIVSETNIQVDESLLTGESLPTKKKVWDGHTKALQPGGDNQPFVYAGTLITQGSGMATVTAVGQKTQMGKIGKSLETISKEDTLLKKEIDRIVRVFAVLGLVSCFVIIFILGITQHHWLDAILSGLTLSISMLPEEFPVVLLIFLTLGAWRMSKKKVLTRSNPAIETLGAATTLCVDKTGTLTENKMRLTVVATDSVFQTIPEQGKNLLSEKYHKLLEVAYLASQKDPYDPLEKEIAAKGNEFLLESKHFHPKWQKIKEYPLSKKYLVFSNVWQVDDGNDFTIATKGAPEAIAELCHLPADEKQKIAHTVAQMAEKGLRIIGVAKANFAQKDLPEDQHDFKFQYVGLLGFADPIRKSVPEAIKECHSAGVRVLMITGDYPGTACFIAEKIGLKNPDKYIDGPQLARMTKSELRQKIRDVNVFARVIPEQKLAIVDALKENGEIVAMTGDGVNDAPSLKSANIGIGMGERGTDVARETSDLILLDDNFSSIVAAIRLGRRIFDNLQKAVGYIAAVHIPIAGIALFPIIFNLPIVLMPAHITFLELIIDPACSTVFESQKEENDIMTRPPRDLTKPLFSKSAFFVSGLQGLSIMAVVVIAYLLLLEQGASAGQVRTVAFLTLVLGNLMLIITNLSKNESLAKSLKSGNKALYFILAFATSFLFLTVFVPALRDLFHFSAISFYQLILGVGLALFTLAWFELIKKVRPA